MKIGATQEDHGGESPLNLIDTFTRECLLIEADHSLTGPRVVRVLEQLVERHGRPEVIRVDNGTEFTGSAGDAWAYRQGVRLDLITKGKPTENGHVVDATPGARERLERVAALVDGSS